MLKSIVIASVVACVVCSVNVSAHGEAKHFKKPQCGTGSSYKNEVDWFNQLPIEEKEKLPVSVLIKVMELKGREVVEWQDFPFPKESVHSLNKMGLTKISVYARELLGEASK